MNEFREIFRSFANEQISNPDKSGLSLIEGDEKDIFEFRSTLETGFNFQLECFDYGIYPYAGNWHSGCWDVTVCESNELTKSLKEFVNSLMNNALLEIYFSNGNSYKWKMHYEFEGELVSDETGLIFYNWFGQKSVKSLSNAKGN